VRKCGLQIVAAVLIGVVLSSCSASSQVISEWRNPAYGLANFKRILVSGPGFATSVRRNFEDEFVAQLRAAGIDALPSYSLVPEEQPDEASIIKAAQKVDADGAIIVRPIRLERKTEYGPGYVPPPWFAHYGPYFGAGWYGWYGAPSVYRYNEYISETTLYDVAKSEIVWSGTIRTTDPDDVPTGIKNYVAAVMRDLNENDLLAKFSQGFGGL